MLSSNIFAISSRDMKASDKWTIESGVSDITLMGRAGKKIYDNIIKLFDNKPKTIAIVCGKGNNGGDGFAVAELLSQSNINVDIYAEDSNTDACRHYRTLCEKCDNVRILTIEDINQQKYDISLDCLFGIGFRGTVAEKYADVIKFINSADYVVACDIPSGLNADNGLADKLCVKADMTVTVQAVKTGHLLNDGKDYCGKLIVEDIGIKVVGEKITIANEKDVKLAFPNRLNNTHKGSYGRVSIVACSSRSIGAGILANNSTIAVSEELDNVNAAAESSMCIGSGLCKIYVPNEILPQMLYRITNSMVDTFDNFGECNANAIAFGMGVGLDCAMLDQVLTNNANKVIDADGLSILANDLDQLKTAKGKIVLTPHPLEFARLSGLAVAEILANPIGVARDFAKKYSVTVLLKGCSTVITDGDRVAINATGSPAMAKGGSGDVLSGVIASLLARNIEPFEASVVASYLCGRAGQYLANKYGDYTVLASDMPETLREVLREIL